MEIIWGVLGVAGIFGILWVGYWTVYIALGIVVGALHPESVERRPRRQHGETTRHGDTEGGQRRGREERWSGR